MSVSRTELKPRMKDMPMMLAVIVPIPTAAAKAGSSSYPTKCKLIMLNTCLITLFRIAGIAIFRIWLYLLPFYKVWGTSSRKIDMLFSNRSYEAAE